MLTSFKEFIKTLEFPFCYYAYMIDREGSIDYFHYGFWKNSTETLKEAQENLASKMKSLIPVGVKRVLDVGCGLGKTTIELAKAGYDVIGISPDVKLMEMAKLKYYEYSSMFKISSFEDYESEKLFDLILFQESTQYIRDIRFLFSHCKRLLNKNGYILICDEVRYNKSKSYSYHEKNEIVFTAQNFGFEVIFNENITQNVLMTRQLGLRFLLENKDSIIHEFSTVRKNAELEIEMMIEGWKMGSKLYDEKIYGYEVFLFQNTLND